MYRIDKSQSEYHFKPPNMNIPITQFTVDFYSLIIALLRMFAIEIYAYLNENNVIFHNGAVV